MQQRCKNKQFNHQCNIIALNIQWLTGKYNILMSGSCRPNIIYSFIEFNTHSSEGVPTSSI